MEDSNNKKMFVCIVTTDKNQVGDTCVNTTFQEIAHFEVTTIYISGFTNTFKVYWEGERIWVIKDHLIRTYEVSDIKRMGKPILPAPGNDDAFGNWVACYSTNLRILSLWACNRELKFRDAKVA